MGNAVRAGTNAVRAMCNVVGIHVHLLRYAITGKDAERGGNKCAFITPYTWVIYSRVLT